MAIGNTLTSLTVIVNAACGAPLTESILNNYPRLESLDYYIKEETMGSIEDTTAVPTEYNIKSLNLRALWLPTGVHGATLPQRPRLREFTVDRSIPVKNLPGIQQLGLHSYQSIVEPADIFYSPAYTNRHRMLSTSKISDDELEEMANSMEDIERVRIESPGIDWRGNQDWTMNSIYGTKVATARLTVVRVYGNHSINSYSSALLTPLEKSKE
ncbi:hypothetical protein BJV82DRAFT_575013 [Fennellomyces sp. T-0311]|nr:hypothetical protein BJV82DRAFT_575013 [Fennellomyces sp. T-0311]